MQQLKHQEKARQLIQKQKSQQQLMEQQKQAQKQQQQKKPSSLMSSIEETMSSSEGANKRKGRSSSSSSRDDSSSSKSKKSSSSSSSSSEDESPRKSTRQPDLGSDDFVSLTNSVRNRFVNGNYRSDNLDEIEQDVRSMPNFYKLSKAKQRKLIADQIKKRAETNKAKISLTISKPAKFAGFISGGGGFETASAARKAFKNIFELQKDEMRDIEMQVEAAHKMHILTGYSQDLEKEYLRLTGVCLF